MRHRFRLRWVLAAGIAFIVVAGLVAPQLSANRYRAPIQRALESALNRRVTIRGVHFNLFTGPGFSLDDVVIEDDPAAGVEPFAHVELMRARVRLAGLFTGRLSFSNLTLVEPSVNFVKMASGGWNFQPLLNRVSTEGSHPEIPEMQISSGRLNFKFGDTKSVFYISDADMDVFLNENRRLVVRFSGEAARTDHASQGLGLLVARGSLHFQPGADDQIDMSVQLERTAINELVKLVEAQDIGLRGTVASNMKLSGPLSHINVSGDLRINDIHRWDLMPNKGEGWTLKYGGFLDLRNQRIDINTSSPDNQNAPLTIKFAASNYLASPQWTASMVVHQLPAGSLLETARHLGAPFPAGALVEGKLDGEVGYERVAGVQAKLVLTDASFKFPQGGTTDFAVAPVTVAGNLVTFGPANLLLDGDQTAAIEARYQFDGKGLSLRISTPTLSVAQTKTIADRLLGTGPLPLLAHCRQGSWKGWMGLQRYDDGPAIWTGDYDLQNTQIEVPGLAQPLHIASATVGVQASQIQLSRIHGHVGDIAIEGDYRRFLDAEQPDRARLTVNEVQLAQLESAFLPTLAREEGFLARTFRLRHAAVPDWLKERQVEGSIQIKNLLLGEIPLGNVRSRLIWNGIHLQFPGVEARLDDTHAAGRLTVSLAGPLPQYRFNGRVSSVDYRNGKLDLDGIFESAGVNEALVHNARSDGTFTARAIELAADTEVDEMSGEFHLEPGSLVPRLFLSKLQVIQGANILHGQGASQTDGRIVLDLTTSGRKQVRLTGMLLPVHVVPATP